MKRKQLEISLSSLARNPKPKIRFEEYDLDPRSASTIVHIAASLGDVEGKQVVDLGCGVGILSIGAAMMGASRVVGVDIDKDSIKVAVQNMKSLGARVEFISGSIDCVRGAFDTTIMNPPFGSWRRGLDVSFLRKSLAISDITYSVHKASDRSDLFLRKKIQTMGKEARNLGRVEITLRRTYDFHQKSKYAVYAYLYRIGFQST
ncbi:MAG: METTL5 family protein [Promethearchaeati archaeon SRVP18_Atabeyarchaeia-1]